MEKYTLKETAENEWVLATKASPFTHSVVLIGFYILIGLSWIYFSDMLFAFIIRDPHMYQSFQTIKGAFYVLVTGLIFFFIIKRRMDVYFKTLSSFRSLVEALEASNAKLEAVQNQLYELINLDPLTKLSTKQYVSELFRKYTLEKPNDLIGLVYVDIDNFSNINEILGYETGDQLLLQITDELTKLCNYKGNLAKISGDEFVCLIQGFESKDAIYEMVKRNVNKIKRTYLLNNSEYFVTLSYGLAVYPMDGISFDQLLGAADLAIWHAKNDGKDQVVLYTEKYHKDMLRYNELSNMLYQAIKLGQFKVHYQPIFCPKCGKATKVEALIRWIHPTKGYISPLEFIDVAEKNGHIKDITRFVMLESFRQQKRWENENIFMDVSVNLSTRNLADPHFIQMVEKIIKEEAVDPTKVILEITESAILERLDVSMIALRTLKQMGFRIALDDFGTGYSSLTYLQKLPIDIIKIDKEFVKCITKEETPLLEFMINLAHKMNLEVIAEGVETETQNDKLLYYNTDYLQGYFYARPDSPENIGYLLKKEINPI